MKSGISDTANVADPVQVVGQAFGPASWWPSLEHDDTRRDFSRIPIYFFQLAGEGNANRSARIDLSRGGAIVDRFDWRREFYEGAHWGDLGVWMRYLENVVGDKDVPRPDPRSVELREFQVAVPIRLIEAVKTLSGQARELSGQVAALSDEVRELKRARHS